MIKFHAFITSYITNTQGATAIEYGLIVAGISMAIAGVVFTFGDQIATTFGTLESKMAEANQSVQ